jgi:hypothetical protein
MDDNLAEFSDEIEIDYFHQFEQGDHIIVSYEENSCNFIIVECAQNSPEIGVAYYNDGKMCKEIQSQLGIEKSDKKCKKSKKTIEKAVLNVDTMNDFNIIKVDYDDCLMPSEVLKKIKSLMEQKKTSSFFDCGETFVVYCKTGKKEMSTIKKLLKRLKVQTQHVTETIKEASTEVVLQNGLEAGANVVACKVPGAFAAALPSAASHIGGPLTVAFGGVAMGVDIHRKYKKKQSGQIESIKFKKYVAKRVTRGTTGIAGSIAGAVIGQAVIPVPVAGAFVGGIVGGLVGTAAGHGPGVLIGKIVEKIDDINEVKDHKAKDEIPVICQDSVFAGLVFNLSSENNS